VDLGQAMRSDLDGKEVKEVDKSRGHWLMKMD
jgi:hypothetical protein